MVGVESTLYHYALVVKLVDALHSKRSSSECRFESDQGHQTCKPRSSRIVVLRRLRNADTGVQFLFGAPMGISKGWTEYHILNPEMRFTSRARRTVQHWLRQQGLQKNEDWVYAGFRSVEGKGKRHIFRIKDGSYTMLLKLTFD